MLRPPITSSDIVISLGAFVVALGVWFIYWQAGVILTGLVLIILGLLVFD